MGGTLKKGLRLLGTLKKGRRVLSNYRAFDLETDGLGGRFIAGAYEQHGMARITDDLNHLIFKVLLSPDNAGTLWVAHNFGGYDSLYVFDAHTVGLLNDLGYELEVLRSGNKPFLITVRKDGMTWRFWDSYKLITMKLEDAANLYNERCKKSSGTIDFDNETFDPTNSIHRQYLQNDVLALQELIGAFREYWMEVWGVEPGYTLPSSAMRAWQHTLGQDEKYPGLHIEAEEFARRCYRGGRVICIDSEIHESVTKLDFNSMYPAVMRASGVPVGRAYRSNKHMDLPGFVRVRVRVPAGTGSYDCVLADDASAQYTTGEFDCHCTTEELAYARSRGTLLVRFYDGYYFDAMGQPFDVFVNRCEALREESKREKNKALEKMVKLAQNSVYGKFGQKREQTMLRSAGPGELPAMAGGKFIDGLTEESDLSSSTSIMPHWAAWITAEARLKLLREAARCGDYLVYCDTDSLVVEAVPEETRALIGEGYGRLKNEGELSDFFVVAPKTWSGYEKDGKHVAACKGIPEKKVTREHLRRARENVTVSLEMAGVRSWHMAMISGRAYNGRRSLARPSSARSYDHDASTGRFVPLDAGRIREGLRMEAKKREQRDRRRYEAGVKKEYERALKRDLREAVLEAGGLKPRKKGEPLHEEYAGVPFWYKRRDGLAGDVLADVLAEQRPDLGIMCEDDLIRLLTRGP